MLRVCGSGLRRAGKLVARPERTRLEQRAEPHERARLELTDPLAGQAELAADLVEADPVAALAEAEAKLDHAPLALGERLDCVADSIVLERDLDGLQRVVSAAVGVQVAELGVALADGLVQRDRRLYRLDASSTCFSGSCVASASSSIVGARPCEVSKRWRARRSFWRRSTTCTGTRIVTPWLATARWRLANPPGGIGRKPLRQSNFSTARLRPMVPSWIRSRSGRSCPR